MNNFLDYDVDKNENVCCICGELIKGYGNSPWPICEDENARCCDYCNMTVVVPERIKLIRSK